MLSGNNASPKQIAEIRQYLDLNTSFMCQVLNLIKSIFLFKFGSSWTSNEPISALLKYGFKVSLIIALPTFLITNILALTISALAAFIAKIGEVVHIICTLLMSISSISYILYSQWIISYKLHLLPIAGYNSNFPQCIYYFTLPILIWITLNISSNIKFYHSLISNELKQDYIKTSYAKGLSRTYIFSYHILKNIIIPLITNIISQIPSLILGALLIENFFSLPGLGSMMFSAINNSDFPIIKAMTALSAFGYIILNTLIDILYIILDPKVRLEHQKYTLS